MNIIVKPYGCDRCYCRPDTTWERENRDFYSPECVYEIYHTPVLFARISKAGKCIGPKFVSRYYDGIGFGMLIYCRFGENESREKTITFGSCADHTSILPHPLYNPVVLESEDNTFEMTEDGTQAYSVAGGLEKTSMLQEAICKASEITSLRIGDFVAVELTEMQEVKGKHIKASYCGNDTIDFKIIR
jgi:hypothetical protein